MAALLTAIFAALIGGYSFLVFFFPKVIKVWEEEAATLSTIQTMMAKASMFCMAYSLYILPILVAGFLISLVALIRK